MADVKWVKLATNIFDNRKIRQIEMLPDGNAVIVVWLKLLCLAGSINDCGMVYFTKEIPYTEQMMAAQFNMPLSTIQLALRTFEQFGMIEVEDDILHIANWEKYQSVDRLNEIREYNRLAQQKSRARRKALANVNDTSMTSQRCHDTDIDKDEDKERRIKKETLDRDNNIILLDAGALEQTAPPKPPKKAKPAKHKYGEYGNVLLSDEEHNKLVEAYGTTTLGRAIYFLDGYIEEKGYKSKSHYLAIRRWVIDAVKDRESPKPKQATRASGNPFLDIAKEENIF